MNIFSAFAILRELLRFTLVHFYALIPHLALIVHQHFINFCMLYSGASTTKEATKTSIIVGRIMNQIRNDRADFQYFLSQIQTRNLNLQNIFFNINWSVLLAVSIKLTRYCYVPIQSLFFFRRQFLLL